MISVTVDQGLDLLDHLGTITTAFRNGLKNMGLESIDGPHPISATYGQGYRQNPMIW